MAQANKVAKIEADSIQKSDSPAVDSIKRLLRNRFAVLGLIIILLNIFVAIFAGALAPYGYDDQELSNQNAAPQWVIDFFPIMQAGENLRVNGEGEILVANGDLVQEGQIVVEFENPEENILAPFTGYVYPQSRGLQTVVNITTLEPQVVEFAENAELEVSTGTQVVSGDLLYVDGGNEVFAQQSGLIYVEDNRIVVRSLDSGFVKVNEDYFLGADALGRDLWSRILYGARVSLAVAFIGPLFATSIGLVMGLSSGYFGGWVDNVIMRIVDILYAFPTLLLIILMMAVFRSDAFTRPEMVGTLGWHLWNLDRALGGLLFIFIGVGITSWLGFARLTRGQVLSVREQDYILAARAMGANGRTIMIRHILPNVLGPLVVAETLTIPAYIRYEAFLSFIGLGINQPLPSWGWMISDGASSISSYPNQAIFPALALFIIMFAFNFLGDGLRDALDPRMRGSR